MWDVAQGELSAYRAELSALRHERPIQRPLPNVPFFLFGMGARRKLLFRSGNLLDARTGAVLERFAPRETLIVPSAYEVVFKDTRGVVRIVEDEAGVFVDTNGKRRALTTGPIALPRFEGRRHARVLRVLLHEILVNVVDGRPLPNFFVYDKPWYRDSAMMLMVLERTGNTRLIERWARSLRVPYDRNNAGEEEADNPGQAMYLVAKAGRRDPTTVAALEAALRSHEAPDGSHVRGRSDFALHPVYQTLWANFGRAALGLPARYSVPVVKDNYALLFWWQKTAVDADIGFGGKDALDYPYLAWAEDHFRGTKRAPLGSVDYPLSWEANASQADYHGARVIDPAFTEQRLAAPHTWHAAEMFLLLADEAP